MVSFGWRPFISSQWWWTVMFSRMSEPLKRMFLMWMKWSPVLGLLLVVVIAAGCGGGGGGGTPAGSAPEAQFTASIDIGSFPLLVAFDASASTDSDGTITQYGWQFGDGAAGSGSSTQHIYTSAGSYTAQLTVTDDSGLSGSASHEIEVKPQYTISGTVASAEHVVADSDVNDSNATPISNDFFEVAQAISAPVTVSGYVNVAFGGPSGASRVSGDPNDYYRVSLTQEWTSPYSWPKILSRPN